MILIQGNRGGNSVGRAKRGFYLITRLSHIGRRKLIIDDADVTLVPANPSFSQRPKFGTTHITYFVHLRGPFGSLSYPLHFGLRADFRESPSAERYLAIETADSALTSISRSCKKFVQSMWGTTNSLIKSGLIGVTKGHQVSLRLVGVGYKASVSEGRIVLKVGFTHNIVIDVPDGMSVSCPSPTKIVISGADLQKVMSFAAKIRAFRKPEPYNGKGIFIGMETITLKEGKKK